MDPNVTLANIRSLCEEIANCTNDGDAAYAAEQLIDHVEALDDWMTKGGVAPTSWGVR